MKTLTTYALSLGLLLGADAYGQTRSNTNAPPPRAARAARNTPPPPVEKPEDGERNLRMNFRGVPLEMVLNYMSEAAGFIIVLETKVEGKVDAWSNQPLNKTEAVEVLNTILHKNGYAAIRSDKTLKIVKREDAKKEDVPVRAGRDSKSIPKNDEFVTQIIPVHYINAAQITKDLQQLLPSDAIMTANESANALVITDTQANVRRMSEIVEALDQANSNLSSIRVFPLKYADSKELATAVKELFTPPTQQGNNGRTGFFPFGGGGGGPGGGGGGRAAALFGGGGPFGGGGGGGGGNRGGASNAGAPGATRVVAVADERTNSLIVSAPDDYMPEIEKLVTDIDVETTGMTEIRVFRLVNSDPMEMADIFAELFPDETNTGNRGGGGGGNQFGFGFRGNFGGFGGGNRGGGGNTQPSERAKKMGKVLAVPDERTSSLIVSASNEVMPQIAEMVAQLDSSAARRQKVYVYSLENADVQQVGQVLQDMFQRSNTSMNRNQQNQENALSTRSRNNQNNMGAQNGFGGNARGGGGGGAGGTGLR